MIVAQLIILLLALQSSCAFIITPFTDFYDFNENCVVDYVSRRNIGRRCENEIVKYKESLIATITKKLKGEELNSECIINQLKFYNVSEVLLKAIAYNYNPDEFVTFEMTTCDKVIKSRNVTDECGYQVIVVVLNHENNSLRNLRDCFNDLYKKFKVNLIVVSDDTDGSRNELGVRNFGKHAVTFADELIKVASVLCEENSTNNEMLEQLYKNAKSESEIFHELSWIDLFGFTQPSKNVERCIIDDFRWRFVSQVHEEAEGDKLKEFTKTVLTCLKAF